jgi:hypothetical protein
VHYGTTTCHFFSIFALFLFWTPNQFIIITNKNNKIYLPLHIRWMHSCTVVHNMKSFFMTSHMNLVIQWMFWHTSDLQASKFTDEIHLYTQMSFWKAQLWLTLPWLACWKANCDPSKIVLILTHCHQVLATFWQHWHTPLLAIKSNTRKSGN